ncbi:MAG: hypothetical protein H6793_00320 [Candidatus Nomurabacteria bacterium]|nr:MAG: hypothetical protein H6793_00320 [Candidatus Nomurabacteria bacterium]
MARTTKVVNKRTTSSKNSNTSKSKGFFGKSFDLKSRKVQFFVVILIVAILGGGYFTLKSFAFTPLTTTIDTYNGKIAFESTTVLSTKANPCMTTGQYFDVKRGIRHGVGSARYEEEILTRLTLQDNGNVVLYVNNVPVWHTATAGSDGIKFCVQTDGNLVLYNNTMTPVWHTETAGMNTLIKTDGVELKILTGGDDNADYSGTSGLALSGVADGSSPYSGQYWTTINRNSLTSVHEYFTKNQKLNSLNGQYTATLQNNGNLIVVRNTDNKIIYSTNTSGSGAIALISYNGHGGISLLGKSRNEVWNSDYGMNQGDSAHLLVMQDDGNLVAYGYKLNDNTHTRYPLWTSKDQPQPPTPQPPTPQPPTPQPPSAKNSTPQPPSAKNSTPPPPKK